MKWKNLVMLSAVATLACAFIVVSAQESGDEVRGAFLSSRPKTTNASATRRRRPPRNQNGNSARAETKNVNGNASVKIPVNGNGGNVKPAAMIGLGYTLFMRDANGRSIRTEPTREFHNGDSVRIALEPNVDGYLYVFHTEGDGPPEMIFPDWRLDGGENWIEAHAPIEVPSSEEADERLRWFTFYGNAGIERLYVVVTREPLPGVPVGSDLVSFCSANKDKCPWHPPVEMWAQVQLATKADVRVVSSKSFGQAQTEKEKTATTRGLGLDQSAPQPSVIRMSAATNAPLLVTVLDLIHK